MRVYSYLQLAYAAVGFHALNWNKLINLNDIAQHIQFQLGDLSVGILLTKFYSLFSFLFSQCFYIFFSNGFLVIKYVTTVYVHFGE